MVSLRFWWLMNICSTMVNVFELVTMRIATNVLSSETCSCWLKRGLKKLNWLRSKLKQAKKTTSEHAVDDKIDPNRSSYGVASRAKVTLSQCPYERRMIQWGLWPTTNHPRRRKLNVWHNQFIGSPYDLVGTEWPQQIIRWKSNLIYWLIGIVTGFLISCYSYCYHRI